MISGATRRQFFKAGAAVLGAGLGGALPEAAPAEGPDAGPRGRPAGVEVLNPRGRVPVSLIIDDSTCLVNLAHFAIPQFAEVFPDRVPPALEDAARARSPTPSSASSASGAASTASRGSTASSPIRPASAGSTANCPAGRGGSWSDSLELVRTLMMPELGHPPRDGHPHLGDRHEDGPAVPGAVRALHGELGLDRRASRPTSWPTTWPMPCAS